MPMNPKTVPSLVGSASCSPIFVPSTSMNDPPYPWRELFMLLKEIGYNRYTLAEISGSSDPDASWPIMPLCGRDGRLLVE